MGGSWHHLQGGERPRQDRRHKTNFTVVAKCSQGELSILGMYSHRGEDTVARDAQASKKVGELCSSGAGFDTKTRIVGSVEKEFYEALGQHGGRSRRLESAFMVPKKDGLV